MHPKLRKIYKDLRACGFKFIEAHKIAKHMRREGYADIYAYFRVNYPKIKSSYSFNENFEEWVTKEEFQLPNGIASWNSFYGMDFVPFQYFLYDDKGRSKQISEKQYARFKGILDQMQNDVWSDDFRTELNKTSEEVADILGAVSYNKWGVFRTPQI